MNLPLQNALQGQTAPEKDRFNGDQQFYIAFAQSWAGSFAHQPCEMKFSPIRTRPITGVPLEVRNQDPWYKAFEVKPGNKLYLAPADRLQIW